MATPPVLVVGDANVDLIVTGDVRPRFGQREQLLTTADLVLGGSAAIVACGLAKLDVVVELVAVVGDDPLGDFVRRRLRAAGVDVEGLVVHPTTPTGLSIILAADSDRAILTHPGTIAAVTADQAAARIRSARPQHVHFSSYFLTPQVAERIGELVTLAHSLEATVSVDTNDDPSGEWDGVASALAEVDVLLPNVAELRALTRASGVADGCGDADAARVLAAHGAIVVVTAGDQGAWAIDRSGRLVTVAPLPVDVVDAVGAGDSFSAGFIAASVHGVEDLAERMRWGVIAGGRAAAATGGTAGQPTLAQLRALL